MGKPAARLTDPTAHGGTIVGPGVPTVLIGKMPAATMGDNHLCPMMTPATPPIPHVGGPITLGSTGVFIGKKPAARMGDMAVCVGPPSTVIMGCPTVLIGEVGSGSQAGSAGSAAAAAATSIKSPKGVAAIKPPAPQSQTAQIHDIHLQFHDDAGKPLSGVPFVLKDHESQTILAASDSEGGYLRGGYAKSGQYEVAVLSLSDASWSGKPEDGKELGLSCKAPNSADGTEGVFQIDAIAESGQILTLGTVQTKVQGEAMQGKWTFRESDLGPARQISGGEIKSLQFLAISGSLAAVSPVLDLGTGKGKYGSAARARLQGPWFEDGSDRIFPGQLSRLRMVAQYLARHGNLKGHIVLGAVGPEGESAPDESLTTKRAQILSSVLMGRDDLFLKRFKDQEWSAAEAQGFLSELKDEEGSPWYSGSIGDDWDQESTPQLARFQREHGLIEQVGTDARFGVKIFQLLHQSAGVPKAKLATPLVASSAPKLPEKVTLEIYFWLRGKGPKASEFKSSAQSVRDDMEKCVVVELGGTEGKWSA